MTKITHNSRTLSALLMVGASSLALASPAKANEYLFTSQSEPLRIGVRQVQSEELTQIRLTGGGTASFTDNAEYQINADGSIELYQGSVTIASQSGNRVIVRMPGGLEGQIFGRGAAANFNVAADGAASGHALTGETRIGRQGRLRPYRPGDMWAAEPQSGPRRVVSNGAQSAPEAALSADTDEPRVAAIGDEAGPFAAAQNGIPVTLGDALAAAGASSDILGAARRVEQGVGNPLLDTFPSGDLALLVARAAEIENANGGSPFPQAQANIIRAYLRFLSDGGAGAQFLAIFSAFSLDYLDLIRAGGVPSAFADPGFADINAYLAFIDRTGALTQLSASDRILAEAYLGFLRSGGNPDLFAGTFTNLTEAFFAFVRAGNAPEDFQDASQAALGQTIAFLSDSGLVQQLSAADQALVNAFLANGGLAFAGQFRSALDSYFAFLAAGGLPSAYEPVDQASLRQFLETLSDTGLLETVLDDQAQFYADYLAFLRAGGEVDDFAGLPVNIFTDYAAQLAAYRAFLDAGNRPSAFAQGNPAQLQAFVAELQAAGALGRFLGADADFFAAFATFVENGGAFDAFAGLNANVFAGYAADLQAYFAFLEAGGVPSTYGPLSQEVIAQYLAELQAAGAKARFLPELAGFYTDYFAFISGGGNPDNFAGLPVPPDFGAFAAALNAYADFLASGGFPADFADNDLSVLASFIEALGDAGELDARLGANADLLEAYFAFLASGGAPNAFADLPIYAQYVTDLNAYFAFLANGGLPADYAELDQATLNQYLAALSNAQGGLAGFGDLNGFFEAYASFVLGGGDPTRFAGLPIFDQYIADLNAYFAFLANGGLPSEYTVLDQATLNAYLELLANAQGGLTGFAGLNAFFVDFFAFLSGGGNADQFAGLAANQGGGGDNGAGGGAGSAGSGPLLGYAGGFDATADLNIYANTEISSQSRIGQQGSVDENGVFTSPFFDLGTATLTDIGGDASAVIGRFTNGTINTIPGGLQTLPENGGLAYAVVAPYTGTVPTTGTIDYEVLSATRPVFYDGAAEPGLFEAALSIAFGSQVEYRMSGAITFADETYIFGTGENFASDTDAQFITLPSFPPTRITLRPNLVSTGRACPSGDCTLQFIGGLAGDSDADRLAFQYRSFPNDRSFSNPGAPERDLIGAVIFGARGTFDANGGGADGGDTGAGSGGAGTSTYSGGFDDPGPNIAFSGVGYNGSNTVLRQILGRLNGPIGTSDLQIAQNGALLDYGLISDTHGATVTDIAGDADLLIGRITDGAFTNQGSPLSLSANQGYHYLLARNFSGPLDLPRGVITYDLVSATQATLFSGATSPGVFEANLAIEFGSRIRFGMDGTITMPGANGFVYAFSTEGGSADPNANRQSLVFSNGGFGFSAAGQTNEATPRGGPIDFQGFIGDAQASQIGMTYRAAIGSDDSISGAAIFGKSDTSSGGGMDPGSGSGTGGGTLVAADFTGTLANQFTFVGNSGARGTGDAFYENGVLTGFSAPPPFVSVAEAENATITDTGINADMAWARWSDGPIRFNGGVEQTPATFSYHAVSGNATQALPASGTVNYDLIGTTPLTIDGSSEQGTLTGDLAIAFGTAPTVGFEIMAALGSRTWSVATTGGVADPTQSDIVVDESSSFRFNGNFNNVTTSTRLVGTGGACSDICSMQVDGRLFGENANSASMFVSIGDRENGATTDLQGLMLFEAAAGDASGGSASATKTAAGIAPSLSPISRSGGTSFNWSRWGGSGSAAPQGFATMQALGLVPPGVQIEGQAGEPRLDRSVQSREAVIRQAERLMGGAITFARPGETVHPR